MINNISRYRLSKWVLVTATALLSACTEVGSLKDPDVLQPSLTPATSVGLTLERLAPPHRPVDVAVYAYDDKTGQQKPTEGFSSFSKAVGQGSEAILVDVLKDVSGSRWFNVVERVGLQNLVTERNLIDQTDRTYRNAQRSNLPPLRYAGIILEGGVTNYDSNTFTGGIGARLLGVGESLEYRRDEVTVALRAVSVSTGEVLTSSTAEKVVYSTLLRGEVFKYVSSNKLLELEAGYSKNEPVGLAVRQAIELAVLSMIVEGVEKGVWSFANEAEERRILADYRKIYSNPRLITASEELASRS